MSDTRKSGPKKESLSGGENKKKDKQVLREGEGEIRRASGVKNEGNRFSSKVTEKDAEMTEESLNNNNDRTIAIVRFGTRTRGSRGKAGGSSRVWKEWKVKDWPSKAKEKTEGCWRETQRMVILSCECSWGKPDGRADTEVKEGLRKRAIALKVGGKGKKKGKERGGPLQVENPKQVSPREPLWEDGQKGRQEQRVGTKNMHRPDFDRVT